jgi:tetratricopeptide (TPR) repeat protein
MTLVQREHAALLRRPAPERVAWLTDVARIELELGQFRTGLERLGTAIAQAFRRNEVEGLAEAWRVQVDALLNHGSYGPARELVVQLEWLAAGRDSPPLWARHAEARGTVLLRTGSLATGEFDESVACYERALSLYGDDGYGRLRALEGLANATAATGRYIDAIAHVDTGLRLSAELSDWRVAHRLLSQRAFSLRDQGYRQPAWDGFELAVAWCEEHGEVLTLARTLLGLGVLLGYRVQAGVAESFTPAAAVLDRALEIAQSIGAYPLAMEIHLARAEVLLIVGDVEGARAAREAAGEAVDPLTAEDGRQLVAQRDVERTTIDQARRLREEQRIRAAFESSPDALFVFDACRHPDGTLTDLLNEFRNSAADALAGLAPHMVRLLTEMSTNPCFANLAKPLFRVTDGRVRYEDVVEIPTPGGVRRYARRAVPAGDGVALTLRDLGGEV